jgi:hypothetical protein
MSAATQSPPEGFDAKGALNDILHGKLEHNVEDDPMVVWDKGVFHNELRRQNFVLGSSLDTTARLQKGTYAGTSLAFTELYRAHEEAYGYPQPPRMQRPAN